MSDTVDCARIHRELRERGAAAVREQSVLQGHIDGCPACEQLIDDDGALADRLSAGFALDPTAETELDAMFGELEREIAGRRGPVEWIRQRSTALRGTVLAVISFALVAYIALTFGRGDLSVYPLPRMITSIVVLVAVILASGAAFLRPLHRPSFSTRAVAALALVAVATPTALCSLPAAHHHYPLSLHGVGHELIPFAYGCFVSGMILALVPIGAAWLLARDGLRRGFDLILAFLGAGVVSNLILLLHCPFVARAHRLAGHATVSAALGVLALGLWWIGPGRRRRHASS